MIKKEKLLMPHDLLSFRGKDMWKGIEELPMLKCNRKDIKYSIVPKGSDVERILSKPGDSVIFTNYFLPSYLIDLMEMYEYGLNLLSDLDFTSGIAIKCRYKLMSFNGSDLVSSYRRCMMQSNMHMTDQVFNLDEHEYILKLKLYKEGILPHKLFDGVLKGLSAYTMHDILEVEFGRNIVIDKLRIMPN